MNSDFDIHSLAAYLHLTPEQVQRMAQRGKLPGRRLSGDWRFSEGEIHHWLEERIGASNDQDLSRYQALLDRQSTGEEAPLRIGDLCSVSRIAVPLLAKTRTAVVRAMCELAATGGLLWDATTMFEAVEARERLHPTALENGVALLHPRRPQTAILAESIMALGTCSSPIPFSDAGHLVDVFLLIASYDDRIHLRTLAQLGRLMNRVSFLTELRAASDPQAAHAVIENHEAELFGE
jgi:PTS system nitrogen regulatory IIA component